MAGRGEVSGDHAKEAAPIVCPGREGSSCPLASRVLWLSSHGDLQGKKNEESVRRGGLSGVPGAVIPRRVGSLT